MIDLTPFCSRDPTRPYLHKPFSSGEFTYATNGHILVRVPRRADVPEVEKAPSTQSEKLFSQHPLLDAVPLPTFKFPEPSDDDCAHCDGNGVEHDCPDCRCECVYCDGSGKEPPLHDVSVEIGGVPFAARYVQMMIALPNLEVAVDPKPSAPMPFRFVGGEGVLMAIIRPYDIHIRSAQEARP